MFRSASDDLERKNQDLLEAQAEGVLLREQLLRCEAELLVACTGALHSLGLTVSTDGYAVPSRI